MLSIWNHCTSKMWMQSRTSFGIPSLSERHASKKVSYGIQFPKSCAIFFSPSSFWWCWWLGIWKQSTGKALTVLLNRLMLNSRHPTTKNLWSSNTVTLDVVFRKFTQMSATLECEPRQIFGAGSTGWRRIKTCLYLNFILDWFNLLINIPHIYLSNSVTMPNIPCCQNTMNYATAVIYMYRLWNQYNFFLSVLSTLNVLEFFYYSVKHFFLAECTFH